MSVHGLHVVEAMKRLSLKRRQIDECEAVTTSGYSSYPPSTFLLKLPYEPLLEVLFHLCPEDILSIRLVNRCLHDISESPALWRNLLWKLNETGREPVLDSVFTFSIEELSIVDAKRIVLRTLALARRWSGDGHEGSNESGRLVKTKIRLKHLPSITESASVYVLGQYSIVHAENRLLCIDTLHGTILAQYPHDIRDPSIKLYNTSFLSPSVLYIQLFGWSSENTLLQFVRLVVPDGACCKPYFNFTHGYIVPAAWSIQAGIVDIHTNSVYLLVLEEPQYPELTLVAIFDLLDTTDTCVMLKSGLRFALSDCKEIMPAVALAGDRLVTSGKARDQWTQIIYDVADLRIHASPVPLHPGEDYYTYPEVVPRTTNNFSLSLPDDKAAHGREKTVFDWDYSIRGLDDDNVLPSICRTVLLTSDTGLPQRWRLTQLYTPTSGAYTAAAARDAINLASISFASPALGTDQQPLVDVSYRFAVWIEETDLTGRTGGKRVSSRWPRRTGAKRYLKVATFPLGVGDDSAHVEATITTLSGVKTSILKRALRIFIRPSLASIFILTKDNMLHRIAFV